MARSPRASVSATSGQGVSRLSYQKEYALVRGADAPQVKGGFSTAQSQQRSYGKAKASEGPEVNISYGDTIEPTDIKDVGAMFGQKPSKSGLSLGLGKAKKLK